MLNPHHIVKTYASKRAGRALDIGAGRGADSYYLASIGYQVDAVDNKSEGMLHKEILTEKNNIHVFVQDIRDFQFKEYSLVVAINSLQFLREDLPEVAFKIIKSLTPGGRLIISLIVDINGKNRMNFDEEYIKNLFLPLEVMHCATRVIQDKPHYGANFPHTHTVIDFIADKT